MKKIYILDTNVLLHDPNAIFSFEDNEVVIPLVVIEEVDGQKRRQDEVGRHARLIAHHLDELRLDGKLSEGVALKRGGKLRVELKHESTRHLPDDLDPRKPDNQVIALTLQLREENEGVPVVLVSKDINVRVKADAPLRQLHPQLRVLLEGETVGGQVVRRKSDRFAKISRPLH